MLVLPELTRVMRVPRAGPVFDQPQYRVRYARSAPLGESRPDAFARQQWHQAHKLLAFATIAIAASTFLMSSVLASSFWLLLGLAVVQGERRACSVRTP
jgi:hypothetical protein